MSHLKNEAIISYAFVKLIKLKGKLLLEVDVEPVWYK